MDVPALALYYRRAMYSVYGAKVWVGVRQLAKFAECEKELCKTGIDAAEYAITVAKLWKQWVRKHGLRCVPVNVFLSKKSFEMYAAAYAVDLDTRNGCDAQVLHDELLVATLCVMYGASVRDVARNIRLSKAWHDAYASGTRPIRNAAEMLCKVYGLEFVSTDYRIIGEQLRVKVEQRV